MNREKSEIYPTLKISPRGDNELEVKFSKEMQVEIVDLKDVETKFGSKTVVTVLAGKNKYNVFLNATSQNALIDKFGNDDENWKGELCNLKKSKNKQFSNEMIVFEPIT